MKTLPRLLLAALLVTAGCGPTTGKDVHVLVLTLTSDGAYQPQPATLTTMTDVAAMTGSVATLLGGGRIILDPNDPTLQGESLTDEQLAQALLKARGIPVRGSFVESGGILQPADFHTWNMITTYYNFEMAFLYFQKAGVPATELGTSTVYYFPYFADLSSGRSDPVQDNALFFSPVQAFMVLPFQSLQTVPLAMNLGIIGHEYSHRVFNKRAYEGQSIPAPLSRWGQGGLVSEPQINLLKSMDEGLADWNGYGVTCLSAAGCNTRFLGASLPAAETDARDMAQNNKCMTEDLRNAYLTENANDFSNAGKQYRVGTVLASALYHAAQKFPTEQGALQQAVLRAYTDNDPKNPGFDQLINGNLATPDNFTLAKVADAILAHITEVQLKTEVCNQFMDRLQIAKSDMPSCPAAAVGGTACPALPPQQ